MAGRIEVRPYDPAWPALFETLRARIWPAVGANALSIEHVGSTAVPGLFAKPVIDIDIVVREADVRAAVERLEDLGYEHRGERGIPQRESFREPRPGPKHNLYVCVEGCVALRNHLAVRSYLRANPEAASAYGKLKCDLAERHATDIDAYIAGKSALLIEILARCGFAPEELNEIAAANTLEKLRAMG